MPEPIKTKSTFGTAQIASVSPTPDETAKPLNLTISFEEALKLHLSLGQALAKLNSYDRSDRQGKRTAVKLLVHLPKQRIMVNEGKLPRP